MDAIASRSTPKQVYIVGGLGLLWSAFGGVDFTMTNLRDAFWLAQLQPDMIDFIDGFPAWAIVCWGLGVWGALAGSLLLLMRSRWTVHAFVASLLGLALSMFYQFSAGLPPSMKTPGSWAMTAVIWIVATGLLLYVRRMRARGVLR